MFTAVITIHVIVSIVLIVTVLLQSGKGASIGASFGGAGSQTLFGSAGPASFLLKITVACAVIFMATSMYMTITSRGGFSSSIMSEVKGVPVKKKFKPAVKPKAVKKTTAKAVKKAAPIKKIKEKALQPAPIVGKKAVKAKKKAVTKHRAVKAKKKAVTKHKAVKRATTVKKSVVKKGTAKKASPAKTAK